RLLASGNRGWSVAILVPTKKRTGLVSDALRVPPSGMTRVDHKAVIELDAALLGSEVIAILMQPFSDLGHFDMFLSLICDYFQGRGGDTPTKGDMAAADRIRCAHQEL